jgi:hypothetical protein
MAALAASEALTCGRAAARPSRVNGEAGGGPIQPLTDE